MQSTKETSPLASGPSGTLRVACVSGTLCLQCLHPNCRRSLTPALLTSLENPGTTTPHQRLFTAVSDQLQKTRSRDSPTPTLVILSASHSLNARVLTTAYRGQTHSALVSSWNAALTVLCQLLQAHRPSHCFPLAPSRFAPETCTCYSAA